MLISWVSAGEAGCRGCCGFSFTVPARFSYPRFGVGSDCSWGSLPGKGAFRLRWLCDIRSACTTVALMPARAFFLTRTLALVLATAMALVLSVIAGGDDLQSGDPGMAVAGAVRGEGFKLGHERDELSVLRVVGVWNGRVGARALQRSRVEVGDLIVEVSEGPATLDRWDRTMRELGRVYHEEMGASGLSDLRVRVRLQSGLDIELEVLGTSKARAADGWVYNAYTGARVAEGAYAELLPADPEPHVVPSPSPSESESAACREIRERFGSRPEGAPCWWLERRENAELAEEFRQQVIADPDGMLPWRAGWEFHPGVLDLVPPHRVPDGLGDAPSWQSAGAYHSSRARLGCAYGQAELVGSVRAGAWAAHAVACFGADGEQQGGALVYAQPDPGQCVGAPWLWDTCGTGRVTLMAVVQPGDGMRPGIPRIWQQEEDLVVGDLSGRWNLVLPAAPHDVPYLQERSLRVG